MHNPLVSIIVPTYNRAQIIHETLNSVLNQSYDNWECIIIDDGSTDETDKLLAEFCSKDTRFKYLVRTSDRPKGANACRNIGIENSKGIFILFLDSDDLLAEFCLEARVRNFRENPNYDFYVFNMKMFDSKIGDSDILINKYPKENSEIYLKLFLSNDTPWPITSLFIKKKVLNFYFDEDLLRFQDILFSIKLLLRKNKFIVFKNLEADCFYRLTESSLARINNNAFIATVNKSYKLLLTKIVKEAKLYGLEIDYKNTVGERFYEYF